ncbi:MAG: trypsin-like peptidase domain-containing protein [Planctomycetaceae bacterium]|nr:trypsin-like peptidase domain-containing protein [Planctomycetaceae bacterium]
MITRLRRHVQTFGIGVEICRTWGVRNLGRKYRRFLVLICLATAVLGESPSIYGQTVDAVAIQKTAATARAVCVRLEAGEQRSSGVIISADGHILTVAHGIPEGSTSIKVVLPDQRRFTAEIVIRRPADDLALLKINRLNAAEKLPYVRVADVRDRDAVIERLVAEKRLPDSVQPLNVLAAGWPARHANAHEPTIRVGAILAEDRGRIRSTCALTAGDSGGPLLTLDGLLLGIHQKIGFGSDSNLHLHISLVDSMLGRNVSPHWVSQRSDANQLPSIRQIPDRARRSIVAYHVNVLNEGTFVSGGVRVSDEVVVCKLSSLGTAERLSCYVGSVASSSTVLIGTDRAMDLAVLQVTGLPQIQPSSDDASETNELSSHPDRDVIVYCGTGLSSELASGIVTRERFREPSIRPTLGCMLVETGSELLVQRVFPNSCSNDAGLAPGDVLISMADHEASESKDVEATLALFEPGDRIQIAFRRQERDLNGLGQLRHSAANLLDRVDFLDGRAGELSPRRTGFEDVFQHDANLPVSAMGGPVVTADGRLVGINIARRSREAVLAIPADVVWQRIRSIAVPNN